MRQFGERDTAQLPVFGLEAQVAIDHRAHLRGVDPEMDARRAQLQRLDLSADRHQFRGETVFCGRDHPVQHVDDF